VLGPRCGLHGGMKKPDVHPLEHHPSFRAVVAAAPVLAELAANVESTRELVGTLAVACSDLADGFAAPPQSRRRLASHHRAWIAVRQIDRAVTAARRRAPADVAQRVQRAIDRADVLIQALLPSS
jgi:hypothetical protein